MHVRGRRTRSALSFGLTLATIVWVTSFVAFPGRLRARVLAVWPPAAVRSWRCGAAPHRPG